MINDEIINYTNYTNYVEYPGIKIQIMKILSKDGKIIDEAKLSEKETKKVFKKEVKKEVKKK